MIIWNVSSDGFEPCVDLNMHLCMCVHDYIRWNETQAV